MSTGIRVRLPRPQLLQIKKGAARIAYEEQEPLAKLAETSSGFCERLKWRKWILVETRELAPAFRHVRLLLARDKGHPDGDREEGYDLLLPLGREGFLDPHEWKKSQESCRVRYFQKGETVRIGRLRRKPGGQWYFDYEEGDRDDEIGFRLGEECFRLGEYVSVGRGHEFHTYQVARVEKP